MIIRYLFETECQGIWFIDLRILSLPPDNEHTVERLYDASRSHR